MDSQPETDSRTQHQGEERAREVCTEREGDRDREGKGGGGGSRRGREQGQVEVAEVGCRVFESRVLLASQDLELSWEEKLMCVCVCVCAHM